MTAYVSALNNPLADARILWTAKGLGSTRTALSLVMGEFTSGEEQLLASFPAARIRLYVSELRRIIGLG
jgi:hypothetical protein